MQRAADGVDVLHGIAALVSCLVPSHRASKEGEGLCPSQLSLKAGSVAGCTTSVELLLLQKICRKSPISRQQDKLICMKYSYGVQTVSLQVIKFGTSSFDA